MPAERVLAEGGLPPHTVPVSLTVDLDRLNDEVKRYSCTPRNYSVNLREELKLTNVVFFPRCLLVQRCGGNCGCGTVSWKSCSCNSGKTVKKYHEVSRRQPSWLQSCNTTTRKLFAAANVMQSPGCTQLLGLFTAQGHPAGGSMGS